MNPQSYIYRLVRFITKEGYVDEDPDPKLWYGYLNPLTWVKDEEQLEAEVVASHQTTLFAMEFQVTNI